VLPGVFCLEGQWEEDLTDRVTVRPTLELLERLRQIQFIHKDVATSAELDHFLDRWMLRAYANYRVGYFAMHGRAGGLELSRRHSVPLQHIAARIDGKCTGRRLYFGSCSVLGASDQALQEFLHQTGAELICGYTKEVDWAESAAFDTVLLAALAHGTQRALLTRPHWQAVTTHLGFRILYSDGRRR
jgi:Family of unknown function (DUF6642)